jgi:uncharacterized protein DUF4333
MRSTFARAAVMLCIAVAAVACSKSLDVGGLETQLESQLNAKLKTTGITVNCPSDIKAESGGEFDCTGTVPGSGTITVHVTQTDSDGHVTWEVTAVATGPTGATTSGPTGTT